MREEEAMSKETHAFYGTKAWRECKAAYLKSVGGLCEMCKAEGVVTIAEAVHHLEHVTPGNMSDPSITLSWSNLQALCRRHHDEVHDRRKRMRYHFDNMGNIIIDE